MKRFGTLISFILVFTSLATLKAQDITGIWRGYFFTAEQGLNYKFEVQVKQNKNSLSGVSYSYQSTQFYAKASMAGKKDNNKFNLQEIRTIEVKDDDGSDICLMNCKLTYSKSGKEEFLEGAYTSTYEVKGDDHKAGDNCGGGTIFLRRVPESDFYQENFLKPTLVKKNAIYDNQAPPFAKKIAQEKAPATTKKIVTVPIEKDKRETSRFEQNTSAESSLSKNENLRNSLTDLTSNSSIENRIIPPVKNNRINEVLKEIEVPDKSIHISIYDNGEIDGDTVSVFVNNKLVVSRKMLTASPIEFDIALSDPTDVKEVTLVAENLGRIPPNTSLMIVESGGKRFEARITSTEQKNAVVRFKLMH
jgi:hypothetical protein